jgi:hypothetical protein
MNIAQHDYAVEARQKLRRHAVIEDVFLGHVVAEIELEASFNGSVRTWHKSPEFVRSGVFRDAVQDLVIEVLEGAASDE